MTPLDQVAQEINQRFVLAAKADDHRLAAGLLLAEARSRLAVEFPEMTWTAWCHANIKRSTRDIKRCLAIAKAPDPIAEREAEKERNRLAKAQQRDRESGGTDVSPPSPAATAERPEMVRAKADFRLLTWQERGEFLEWVRATGLY